MAKAAEPHILVVDDDEGQRSLLSTFLTAHGMSVSTAADGTDALGQVAESAPAMVVSDVRMKGMTGLELLRELRGNHPALPVLLVTAYADVRDAVDAMRDGAVSYLEKPIVLDELLQCVHAAVGTGRSDAVTLPQDIPALPDGIVAQSPAMMHVLEETAVVAPTDSRVLLTGESGTGKEVIANLLHAWSLRADGPIVKLNCAAIPESLLESELFGHERGSFTGAHRRRVGRFEEADSGTLFLDEIGDLSPALQAKLLRAIQEGVVERVGANTPVSVNVRVIAATNRDLEAEVACGNFREDLFYRLNVFEIHIPPLRERPEDILPMAEHFANTYSNGAASISGSLAMLLPLYSWPGNVRELQNAMERAVLLARGGAILPDHLPRRVRSASPQASDVMEDDEFQGRMEQMESMLILQTLREHGFNRTETARALGIGRRTLTYKLRRLKELGYQIDPG